MNEERDLRDMTILVTGASSGIGQDVIHTLAVRGASVIGVARSPEPCRAVREAALAEVQDVHLSFAVADLASQRQILRLARDVRRAVKDEGSGHIDALIHGAQTMPRWRQVTEDGYELQFAVNHLAPFLLTHELMPLLHAAPSGRVITLSSRTHRRARIKWRDVMFRRRYSCSAAFRQSKLANMLFTAELNRRLGEGSTVRGYAVEPSLASRDVAPRDMGSLEKLVRRLRRWRYPSPEEAVRTIVFLAAESLGEHANRIYWSRGRPARVSARALRRAEAARLWMLSERLCGLGSHLATFDAHHEGEMALKDGLSP